MTIYILRYSSDGDTSHVNEGFRNKQAAEKRFRALKKQATKELEFFNKSGLASEAPPSETFDYPLSTYLRKVTVKNTDDLILLVNKL